MNGPQKDSAPLSRTMKIMMIMKMCSGTEGSPCSAAPADLSTKLDISFWQFPYEGAIFLGDKFLDLY
jgi:hypothetical protein